MNLKDLTKVELEALSYTDITAMILKEENTPMTTPMIFKKICALLGYTEEEYADKIGDYYTSLTTDRRFILLDTAEWDLKDHHVVKIVVDDDEEEEITEDDDIEEEEDEKVEEEDDIDAVIEDDIDDESDLEDLTIVSEEDELEEEN